MPALRGAPMGSPSPRPPCLSFPRGGRPPSLGAGEEEWGAPGGAASVASEAAWGSVNTPHPFFQAPACRLKRRRACVRVCGQGKGPPAPGRTYLKAPSAQLGRGVGNTEGGGSPFLGWEMGTICAGGPSSGAGGAQRGPARPQHPSGALLRAGETSQGGGPGSQPHFTPIPSTLRAREGARCQLGSGSASPRGLGAE